MLSLSSNSEIMILGNWRPKKTALIKNLDELSIFDWVWESIPLGGERAKLVCYLHKLLREFNEGEGPRAFGILKKRKGLYELSLFGDPKIDTSFRYGYPNIPSSGTYVGERWVPEIEDYLNRLGFRFEQHLCFGGVVFEGVPRPHTTVLDLKYILEERCPDDKGGGALLAVSPSIGRRDRTTSYDYMDIYIRTPGQIIEI